MRTEPIRRCWPIVSAASLLVSCAETPTPTVEDGPVTTGDIELAPRCEGLDDVSLDPPAEQQPDADESLTTAEPIDDLIGVEQDHDPANGGAALEQARGRAEREAGDAYAGMWLDQARDAVVFHGRAELLAVQSEIDAEELPPAWEGDEPATGAVIGTGQRDPLNRVIVTVFEFDEPRLAELSERYGADLICVEDGEPPQPLIGEGENG